MESITLRKLTENDFVQFLPLINEFRYTEFNETDFKSTLSYISYYGEIWVAEYKDELIATATVIFEKKFIYRLCTLAHIEDVCVKNHYRRMGVGKKLIHKLIERAKENKCYKITLNCSDENINFYKECGFSKRGNQMSELCEFL
jgi:glucosamine-phosphate N-acetyltransferase